MWLSPGVLLAVLSTSLAGLQHTGSEPTAVPPAPAMTTYRSDAIHLSYNYPVSFESLGGTVNEAIGEAKSNATGVAKAAVDCVSAPLAVMQVANDLQMIFMIKLDGVCLGTTPAADTLGGLVVEELKQSMVKFGTPTTAAPTSYTLAGHNAAMATGSVNSTKLGGLIYGSASCLVTGKDTVCWEFISNDCSRLATLGSYGVSLDGNPPEPVIPSKLLPACKP